MMNSSWFWVESSCLDLKNYWTYCSFSWKFSQRWVNTIRKWWRSYGWGGHDERKGKKTGYSTTIRIITTGNDVDKTEAELANIISAFSQFASPSYNRFKPVKRKSLSLLIRHYVFRQFTWWQHTPILNSEELATLFHFPHSKYNKQPEIRWQRFKAVKVPTNVAKEWLYIGDNVFRNEKNQFSLKTKIVFGTSM